MDGPPDFDHQSLFNWVVGILMALLTWVAGMFWGELKTLRTAASSYVPRAEMQKHLDDMRAEVQRDIDQATQNMLRMHGENLGRFDKIDDSMVRLHERLDNSGPRKRATD